MTSAPQQSFEQGRPDKVDALRKVAVLSLIVAVIGALISMVVNNSAAYQQEMADFMSGQGLMSGDMTGGSSNSQVVGSISGLVLAIALYLIVISGLSKGRNWARILGIVCALISIVSSIGSVALSVALGMPLMAGGALGVLALVWSILQLAVDIYWLTLAFDRRVAAWFSGRR